MPFPSTIRLVTFPTLRHTPQLFFASISTSPFQKWLPLKPQAPSLTPFPKPTAAFEPCKMVISQPRSLSTTASRRIIVTRRVAEQAMQYILSATPKVKLDIWDSEMPMPREVLLERLRAGADGLYCMLSDRIDKKVIEAGGDRLKVVSTMSVGYNHVDLAECVARGIVVANTPDVLTETTADTAVGLVLATCRRFKEAARSVENGTWGTWTPFGLCGMDVHGSVVGIVGMGRIGAAVGRRLKAFGCTILYSGRSRKLAYEQELGASFVPFENLLETADIVIPLCPLNEDTKGMFDITVFKRMKQTAVFINAARGELVNQEHLVRALNEKHIFGAGLDVTVPEPLPMDSDLIQCENCYILPHIGSASGATRTEMALMAARNLVAALEGGEIPSKVV